MEIWLPKTREFGKMEIPSGVFLWINSQFGRRPKILGDLGCKTLQKTPFWKAKNTFPHLKMLKNFACGALGHTESITSLYFVVFWLQNTSQVRKTTLKSNNTNRKRCFWKRQKWGLCWSIARRRRNFFRVYGENCELTPPLVRVGSGNKGGGLIHRNTPDGDFVEPTSISHSL